MINVPMIDTAGDMLQLAMMTYNMPAKAFAIQFDCSISHIYSAAQGLRSLPKKAMHKIAGWSIFGASAVGLDTTNFRGLFGYLKVDRHMLAMLKMSIQADKEVAPLTEKLFERLWNKNSRADLDQGVLKEVEAATAKIVQRMNVDWNLLMELEARYEMPVVKYLQGKESEGTTWTRTHI